MQARRRRRGLVGEIVARIERKGLKLAAAELRTACAGRSPLRRARRQALLRRAGRLPRSPVFAMIVEGPSDNTWELGRILIGKTQVTEAQPGSIRGDFATTTNENLVHGSDGPESAEREIALWFPGPDPALLRGIHLSFRVRC
ncbi:MAG: nucleoside-diphosphate kinase [Acidimicrobiales bacterium]